MSGLGNGCRRQRKPTRRNFKTQDESEMAMGFWQETDGHVERQDRIGAPQHTKPPYLPNAPRALIDRYEHSNPFKGQDILGRMLTDASMGRPWKLIQNSCPSRHAYLRLWSHINYAFTASRTAQPSRAKKRDEYLAIKRDAEQLARTISNGSLDRLAYEFFPDDGAQLAFKSEKWPILGPDDRRLIAYRRVAWWPSLTDMLTEVAWHAGQSAEKALTEERFAINDTHDRRVNYFLRYLAQYFRTHFNGPMKGVLAVIASVVFEKPIDLAFVKRALRHSKPLP